jgi:hypothetical protein
VREPSRTLAPNLRQRIAAPFKEFGMVAGALYVIDRVLRMLPRNLAKAISFEEIKEGHPDIALMPARADIKAQRFAQGARCLGAYRKGELISYLWFCQRQYEEDLVRCTYELVDAAHSIFDFDLYVMPEHRLGLGFLGIWHGANQFLEPQGVRYTFSRLTRFNTASRRAHVRLGWKCLGRATFFCAWGLEVMFCTLAPYVAVTVGHRRVRLRFQPAVLLAAQAAHAEAEHASQAAASSPTNHSSQSMESSR